jgi:hypothetical protein
MLRAECRCRAVTAVRRHCNGQRSLLRAELSLELPEKEGVVFGADSAQELETHNEERGADAACGEHGVVGDVP